MNATTHRIDELTAVKGGDRRRLLFWAACIEASVFAAIGIRHIDREAIAFAALFLVGALLVRRGRRGLLGMTLLAVLALDTGYWMVTALVTNIQSQGQALAILQPLALVIT